MAREPAIKTKPIDRRKKPQAGLPRVGCAGWSLSSAPAEAFPAEGSHLARYAQVFSAVEINSSFYRPHRPATYARWRDSVPADFRFSAKLPRSITHDQRLQDVDALLDGFLAEVGELRDKLGCLLVQLPPSLVFEAGVADTFFSLLRARSETGLACEARHASWFTDEAAALLSRHRVASVEADPPPVAQARAQGDADLVYLRLHGTPKVYYSAYEEDRLQEIADGIAAHRKQGKTVWCVFDNTAKGHAVPNALRLRALLGMDPAGASSHTP
jgi:uncharacterized protein YecE (DUF72 family)